MSVSPAAVNAELVLGRRASDAAGEGRYVSLSGGIHIGIGDHVGDREAPAWAKHARAVRKDPVLIGVLLTSWG
jgi:hypothetical protein